ncbi:MAG: DUF4296 domain-containing protein [Schleiferiaceae bacterium]|jgi:hypothetical protein|nr:DUF4296 domain-containing protein [Schleiferiaceae bacterium]
MGVTLLISCKEKDVVPEPEGLLPPEKMVAVLTDVHLIEGARTGLVIMGDSTVGVREHYKAFFEKHNVTQAEFDSSFVYYSKNPKEFDEIYVKVIENLSVIESEVKGD